MKYLSEYRDPELVQQYLEELHRITTRSWTIMEVCGGQTHSLVKNGILRLLPEGVTMVHGPGCPVFVTPVHLINKAVHADRLEEEVMDLATTVAGKLGSAVRIGKRAFYDQIQMPLDKAYNYTGAVMVENMLDEDTAEGIAAFIEKRAPAWAQD